MLLAASLCGACGGEATSSGPLTGPARLVDTGLYSDAAPRALADGIVTVSPRYPLWSDGAEKQRYLSLPPGTQIDTSNMDDWKFPVGTRVWKSFSLDGRLVETRLLEKRREPDDGGWFQMSYAWLDDESDAVAVPEGVTNVRGTTYEIPAQRDCRSCHYHGEKPIIGISALQLSTTADGSDSPSMAALLERGWLSAAPARRYTPPGTGVVQDALGYLHGNCGYCHYSKSAVAAEVKVFMNLFVADDDPLATQAYRTLVGQPIHHFPDVGLEGLVVPGKPDKSLVHYRMDRRDVAQMPPIVTHELDESGVATVDKWILGLAP